MVTTRTLPGWKDRVTMEALLSVIHMNTEEAVKSLVCDQTQTEKPKIVSFSFRAYIRFKSSSMNKAQ